MFCQQQKHRFKWQEHTSTIAFLQKDTREAPGAGFLITPQFLQPGVTSKGYS